MKIKELGRELQSTVIRAVLLLQFCLKFSGNHKLESEKISCYCLLACASTFSSVDR